MKRAIQLIAIAIVATVAFSVTYATVFAHADYESSVPDRNEVVAGSPDEVQVFFTQDVIKREGLYYVRVFDENDVQVSEGDGVVNDDDRSNINAELPQPLEPGRYVVEWMTTSDIDGDDDEGAFCFYVAVEPTAEQQAECAEFADEPLETATQGAQSTEPAATQADGQPTEVSPTAVPPDGPGDGDDGGTNVGLIVAIVVGVIVVAAVLGGGYYLYSRE